MFMFIYDVVYKFAYNLKFDEVWAAYADANGTVQGLFEGLNALSVSTRAAKEFGESCATAAVIIAALIAFLVAVGVLVYLNEKYYAKQATIEA